MAESSATELLMIQGPVFNLEASNPVNRLDPRTEPQRSQAEPATASLEQSCPWHWVQIWEIRGTKFWGPYNTDLTIQGTRLGSPIFGNSHLGW